MSPIFPTLGDQLKRARQRRNMTQPDLAARVGRDRARISELERDLLNGRMGRDRLTLLAEICDALDLVPVLMSRRDAATLREEAAPMRAPPLSSRPRSTFDEVFVDLADPDEAG